MREKVYACTNPSVSFADSVRLAVPEKRIGLTLFLAFFDRCGNSGFASERLAAFAVPGPVSRRPANGAAAEIPVTLFLPPAARNRNPATGSAKPQFPRRGRQDAPVRKDTGDGGDPSAPVCALGHLPFQGRQDAAARHDSLGQFLHSFISEATSFLHFPGG